jgi:hypothetical protein
LCDHDGTNNYGVIEEAYHSSVHTAFMALGAAYGKSYVGKIEASFNPSYGDEAAFDNDAMEVNVIYTPYGETLPTTFCKKITGSNVVIEINEQLAALSELTITINAQGKLLGTGILDVYMAEEVFV